MFRSPLLRAALLFFAVYVLPGFSVGFADEPPKPSPSGTSHVMIVCGLAGDDAHRESFTTLFADLLEGLEAKAGVPRANAVVLYGEPELFKKPNATSTTAQPPAATDEAAQSADGESEKKEQTSAQETPAPKFDLSQVKFVFDAGKEQIAAAGKELAQRVGPNDTLWVIVVGHAHFDGRWANLNLPGPDMNQAEFARAFAEVRCERQVFMVATAVSGFFLRPLSQPGRILISATEADLEVNEPMFATKLAERLKTLEETPDVDSDGDVTMLDLYVGIARDVATTFQENMQLATEHALIEDTNDNRPSELQAWYLPEKLGGRRREGDPIPKLDPKQDGFRSSQWFLAKYVPPPPPPEAKSEEKSETKPEEAKPEETKTDETNSK